MDSRNCELFHRRDVLHGSLAAGIGLLAPWSMPARAQPVSARIRREVHDPQAVPMLELYKSAVRMMRELPPWDPTSWWFQATSLLSACVLTFRWWSSCDLGGTASYGGSPCRPAQSLSICVDGGIAAYSLVLEQDLSEVEYGSGKRPWSRLRTVRQWQTPRSSWQ